MALNIAYFAWVRERMGIAEEVVDVPQRRRSPRAER